MNLRFATAKRLPARRDAKRLLEFGKPGLNFLAHFRIRRRRVLDPIEAHHRKTRLDAGMGTQEAFLGE